MKVIFFDIDGTLSDFEGKIPESAIRGIKETQKKGNITALCSGRSENQIDEEILAIGFDAVVSAAGAHVSIGGAVRHGGKPIYEATIPAEQYARCLAVTAGRTPDLCVQTNEEVFISESGYDHLARFTRETAKTDDPRDVVGNLIPIPSLSVVKGAQKMFYHNASVTVDELQRELGAFFTVTELSFGKKDPYCGEITMNGIEKSTGMEQLMRHYGLTREDSVAFGDGPNDVDMMEYAGIAVCMGNGRDEIKALADYVTADIGDDGIYKGLAHFNLL